MKKSILLLFVAFSCFIFSQTINIHTNDGSVAHYNLSDIDSITFTVESDGIDGGHLYGDFGITDSTYTHDSDWDEICQTIFGSEYEVVDWTDLESYHSEGGDLAVLLDGLGLTDYRSNAFVKNEGNQFHSGTRAYFIERHDHNKPSTFSAHDHIDNYLISLGSWQLTKQIIVHKK
jgi:hypothetical protein